MSTLNAPTVGGVHVRPGVTAYPRHMLATIATSDGRHTLTALFGVTLASPTDGRGGWQEVSRSRKPSVIEWLGPSSHKVSVELLLDAFASGGTIEAQLATVDAIAPVSPVGETPTVYVTGAPLVSSTIPWVVQGVSYADLLLREDGRPARVSVTFDLLQYRQGDVVIRNSPAKAAAAKAGTTRAKARTVTVKAGDTLSSLAAKYLGSASKWTTLAKLNSLRDPNHLKVGQVIRLS